MGQSLQQRIEELGAAVEHALDDACRASVAGNVAEADRHYDRARRLEDEQRAAIELNGGVV